MFNKSDLKRIARKYTIKDIAKYAGVGLLAGCVGGFVGPILYASWMTFDILGKHKDCDDQDVRDIFLKMTPEQQETIIRICSK